MPATVANICDRHFCVVRIFLFTVFAIFLLQLRQVFLRFLFRFKTHLRALRAEFYHITVGFLFEHGGFLS